MNLSLHSGSASRMPFRYVMLVLLIIVLFGAYTWMEFHSVFSGAVEGRYSVSALIRFYIALGLFSGCMYYSTSQLSYRQFRRNFMTATDVSIDDFNRLSANIMICDRELTIIYLNASVERLLTQSEGRIRQQLPTFSAHNLIGKNIDVFHKNPAHQRSLLGALTYQYTNRIRVGELVFKLVVTPLNNPGGEQKGFAVEWFDETEQANFDVDLTAILTAIADTELHSRINASIYQGKFKDIADSLNTMLESVVAPITEARSVLSEMAASNLTTRMIGEYKGVFEELKDSINDVADSLQSALLLVSDSVQTTSTTAAELSLNAGSMAAATQELSSQTDEIAGAIEQMSNTIADNARSATKTSEFARQNGDKAIWGGEVVHNTIQKMTDIAEVVKNSVDTIERLGHSSQEISEIVSVINDIADQTNLLALNAAIEAARAGDQGRGFAVVADEVRKLAERTSEATKQIAIMIKGIQSETGKAVSVMNKGNDEVQKGITLADQAGTALRDVVKSSQNVFDMIHQIAIANEQQATTAESISRNISAMTQVTSSTAQQIEEIASAAQVLTSQSEQLNDIIHNFDLEHTSRRTSSTSSLQVRSPKLLSPVRKGYSANVR